MCIRDRDYIIPTNLALPEIPLPKITDVEKAIGRNCASLIEDGSTLQLGIGAIPDAVLLFMGCLLYTSICDTVEQYFVFILFP